MTPSQRRLLLAIPLLLAGMLAHAATDYHAGRTPSDLSSQPVFAVDWRGAETPAFDLSSLLEAPAGKHGHIIIREGRLAFPDGRRFRIWGVNATGSAGLPAKTNAPQLAARLAGLGINCVRFHMLDRVAPGGLIAAKRDDTRQLDPDQLDRLDFFLAELKKWGIYSDLNLNVGRTYKAGDGVRDFEYLGFAKAVTFFDERLLELQREFARQLLTHRNPYTGLDYTADPAVALVEFLNENSLVESWMDNRLRGLNTRKNPGTWTDITAAYAADLTARYNAWLGEKYSPETLRQWREAAGLSPTNPIPRLAPDQFGRAQPERFHAEAEFYLDVERRFYLGMTRFLRQELGVKSLLVGNSDHSHYKTGYPQLAGISLLDVVDSHVYWQHPNALTDPATGRQTGFTIGNTPMVDDPLFSTVVQLSRSAFAAKPFTVSEVNHPFPNEFACEGIPILAAYGALQDWDGIFWYTLAHQDVGSLEPYMRGHFDFATEPVKMAQIPAGALMFLRADVQPARRTMQRSLSRQQVRGSILLSSKEHRPYFTPGFPLALPLQHGSRIGSLDGSATVVPASTNLGPIVSDTGELTWTYGEKGSGLVSVNTDRSQALVGFLGAHPARLKHLFVESRTPFCAVTLSALDDRPIAGASLLLLTATARMANTDMVWNEKRNSLGSWGKAPTRIEPVAGSIRLVGLAQAKSVTARPLNGAGAPMESEIKAARVGDDWTLPLSAPALSYLIRVSR
jgi:hypothetical protein